MRLTIISKRVLDDAGEWVERKSFLVDGAEVSAARADELFPDGDSSEVGLGFLPKSCSAWPLYSDGAGVHPEQVAEAEAHAKEVGVPTRFLKDGRAVFTSLNHQREFLRAHHMHNRDDNAGGPSRTYRRKPGREEYV